MILTYLIVFIVFAIGRFFIPAKLAIIPEIVEKKELLLANSLVNITGMIAAILGFGVSGVLVEWLGARSGFYLDALSFLISALLIFFITKRSSRRIDIRDFAKGLVGVIRKSVPQEIKEGVLYFIKEKKIRFTAGIIFILWAALGAVYVVLITFVQQTLGSATKDLGLLSMFLGVGLFLGSVVYGRFGQHLSEYKIIFASLILSGIMLVVFSLGISNYPSFLVAALLSFSLGLLVSPIMIASNTIIHNVSDNEMLGKIFSSMEIIMHLGFLLFMFISGFLAEIFTKTGILIAVGIIFALVGLVNLIYYRKIPWLN
jgi:MFS family permease